MAIAAAVALIVGLPGSASAQGRGEVGGGWQGYTSIPAGTVEFNIDTLLLLNTTTVTREGSDTSTTQLDATWTAGLTGRIFAIKNLGLGLHGSYFFDKSKTTAETAGDETETSEADNGFLGFAMIEYYVRLGNSMFFTPGLGLGFFSGTRERPIAGTVGQIQESDISGFAGRFHLGAVFYTSRQISLRAGIVLLGRFGSETAQTADDTGEPEVEQDFTSIDAGFNIGFGYAF
jgi:hypothetical protein